MLRQQFIVLLKPANIKRVGQFAEVRSIPESTKYVTTPTLDTARKLKEFGLDASQRKSFYLGKQVIFEDSATIYPIATIFKYENHILRVGIYDIISEKEEP